MSDLRELCEWRQQAMDGVSHFGWHHGFWCPYVRAEMLMTGLHDPNEQVAEWRLNISRALKTNGSIPLSLNDSRGAGHYAGHQSKVTKIQAQVRRVARELEMPRLAFAHIELHFQPKTRAPRDPDNLVPTLKAAIDGLHHEEKPNPSGKPREFPWTPILPGDDPRYVSWSQPMIHAPGAQREPLLWLIVRSPQLAEETVVAEPVVAELPL